MNKTEDNEKYILTQIKKDNFYYLYNRTDERSGKILKDLFSYSNLVNNYNYSKYDRANYEELVNMCYSLLELQLQLINNYVSDDSEEDIKKIYYKLPKNITNIVNKNGFENTQLSDIINTETISDINLHHLMAYVDAIQDILEMLFEPVKYEEMRKEYLQSDEGKQEALLLEQVKLKMFN